MANFPGLVTDPKTGMLGYRKVYPADVRAKLDGNPREFKRSFGTRDHREALEPWKKAAQEADDLITAVRVGEYPPLSEDEAIAIARTWWEDHAKPMLREAAGPNDVIRFYDEAELVESLTKWLSSSSYTANPGGARFKRIVAAAKDEHDALFAKTVVRLTHNTELAQRAIRRGDTPEVSSVVQSPLATAQVDLSGLMPGASKSFHEHLETFIAARKHEGSTASSYRKAFRDLRKLIGDKPIVEVAEVDIETYYQWLKTQKSDKNPSSNLSFNTLDRNISHMRQFFAWAEVRKLVRNDPARKIKVEKPRELAVDDDDKRDPFTAEDLKAIFHHPLYTGRKSIKKWQEPGGNIVRDHLFWFPLILLHTGMRPSEVQQLEFTDIIEVNGRPHISINRESKYGNKKTLKTKRSAIRQIPVHPMLIALGFLGYVDSRKQESKNGKILPTYRWSRFLNKEGLLGDVSVWGERKVGYSFRHTFRGAIHQASADEQARDRIFGHHHEGTGGTYLSRNLYPRESEIIDSVKFDVDLSHLIVAHNGSTGAK